MKRITITVVFVFFSLALNLSQSAGADYKPLPKGTVVTYDSWSFKVLSSDKGSVFIPPQGWKNH